MIPHVNLSISGYEPDSLRTSGMRSPSVQAQEVSTIPQLYGPRSLPMRDPAGRADGLNFQDKLSRTPPKEASTCRDLPQLEEESTQEETVIVMVIEDHIKIGDPLIEEDILTEVGDPLTEEDTLVEDPLKEDILMEMGDPWKSRIPWWSTS